MRFLADENFPGDAVTALQNQGYDIVWVRLDAPGTSDRDILTRAQDEGRVILTFDKDFGELAFRLRLPALSGIILFRIPLVSPRNVASLVISALETRSDWSGLFTVVESDRIRVKSLPGIHESD